MHQRIVELVVNKIKTALYGKDTRMSGEQFSMDALHETRIEFELGLAATGTIEPGTRELSSDTLSEVEREVLSSRFDGPVMEGVVLPCGCMDGRCPHSEAAFNAVPNAAGGTLSLVVGEMLTGGRNIASTAENTEEALASLIEFLKKTDKAGQIGGHTGPAHGPNAEAASGCGANDALHTIFGQIVEKADLIKGVIEKLGADTTGFDDMVANAVTYYDMPEFFSAGKTVSDTLRTESPEGNCPELTGAHNEVLIRLNTVEGTTIDRRALQAAYGDEYQIFNVDVWALRNAAETLSATPREAAAKFTAMVAYQVATALQLCGQTMKVIVR